MLRDTSALQQTRSTSCCSADPLTSATVGRGPAPGAVGQTGALGAARQLVGPVAEVLQGDQHVVGAVHQEVVPVGWLGRE